MGKRRRGDGEGSIRRRKDGRWEACLRVIDSIGRRSRRSVYGRTRADAVAKLDELRQQAHQGLDMGRDPTLGQYVDLWLANIEGTVRASTLGNYRQILHHHVTPFDRVERIALAHGGGPPGPRSGPSRSGALGYYTAQGTDDPQRGR